MRVRLGDDSEYVDISASREAYKGGATGPDIFLGVDVRLPDFRAAIGCIVERGDWERFVQALSQLEKFRRGEAVLESADGHELRLRLYAADGAGHIAVSGEIHRCDLPSEPRFTFQEVPVDSTLFTQLVGEFARVTSKAKNDSTV